MPTYQYTCTDCGDQLEAVQKFTDDSLTLCGACGGRLRKVFSPVGIVFKGSGFYRTDSRNGSAVTAKSDSASSSADSSANGSNGTADKPAAKKTETAAAPAKSSASSEKVA